MQLWQLDIVGGVQLVNPATGMLRVAKLVTAVDDHSRFCVIAKVVERATARAVCLALAEALSRFGVPEEIITDNGKQFTDRFGKYRPRTGEVLFDKICRKNGIPHRLTARRHRTRMARWKGSRARCARSSWPPPDRSPGWPKRRRRWMPGWSITPPTGLTKA
jgi:transposase InsO family protein